MSQIKAIQFDGNNSSEVLNFFDLKGAVSNDVELGSKFIAIFTENFLVFEGDFLCKNSEGGYNCMKPTEFNKLYERA